MARREVFAVILGCLLSLIVCEATYSRTIFHKAMVPRNHHSTRSSLRCYFLVHIGHYVKSSYMQNLWNKVRKCILSNMCRNKFGRYSSSTIYHFIKSNSHILPLVFKNTAPKYKREKKTWYILKRLCCCYHHMCKKVVGGVTSTTSKVHITPPTPVTSSVANTVSSTLSKRSTITSTETPVEAMTSRKMTTSHKSTSSVTTPAKPVTLTTTPVTSPKFISSTTKSITSGSTDTFVPIIPDAV